MVRRKYRAVVGLCILAISTAIAAVIAPSVAVYAKTESLDKNAYAFGVKTCASSTGLKSEADVQKFLNEGMSAIVVKGSGKVVFPTRTDTLTTPVLTCAELFQGGNKYVTGNVFSAFGKGVPTDIRDMGYGATVGAGESTQCYKLNYQYNDSNGTRPTQMTGSTDEVCFKIENGKVAKKSAAYGNDENADDINFIVKNGSVSLSIPMLSSKTYSLGDMSGEDATGLGAALTNKINSILSDATASGGNKIELKFTGATSTTSNAGGSSSDKPTSGTAKLESNAYKTVLKYLTTSDNLNQFRITEDNKYNLYRSYYQAVMNDAVQSANIKVAESSKCDASIKKAKENFNAQYAVRSGSKWCGITGVESVSATFALVADDLTLKDGGSFADVVRALEGVNYGQVEDPGELDQNGNLTGGDNDGSDGDTASVTDGCFSEAGVLGWILCPVLRYVGQAANSIYEDIESTYLQVNPSIINGASNGWTTFRNFANTIFAAVFVLVILSQITGFGISNYGIKKILPRLIVVVVLVNVSFFICEAAVDLSNILGYSFNQFFRNLGTGGNGDVAVVSSATDKLLTIINSIGAGAGAVGIGFAIAEGGWLPFLVPLLVAAITMLIGIFFFFVILGVRQVGIVILAVVSPIAIILYALPNTQKLFGKWLKLFADLLLVYPICGLLMGGSEYASRLLLSPAGDGTTAEVSPMYYFVVLLLSVVPFFFIPTILRGSVNGIARLGDRIQGMGQRLGRTAGARAGGGIMRSNWARTNMEEHQRNANERYHTRRVQSLQRRLESGRPISERERARLQRQLNRSNAMLERYHDEDGRAAASGTEAYLPGSARYEARASKIEREQLDRDIDGELERIKSDSSIDKSSVESLADAHANALQAVYDNPNDRNAQVRVAALEKTMMKMKPDDGAAYITSNYAKHLQQGVASGNAGDVSNRLGRSAERFKDENSAAIKQAVGKSGLGMVSDIASGNTGGYVGGSIKSFTDNNNRTHYYNSAKIGGDAEKVTGRDFENYSDAGFDTLAAALDGDDISKPEQVQRVMDAITEFRTNPNINKKNSAMVDKLERKALAAGARSSSVVQSSINSGANVSTSGSSALNGVDPASLRSIASQISSGQLNGLDAARIVSNIELAANDNSVAHTQDWADAANEVMAAANKKGINQLVENGQGKVALDAGSTVADRVDVANIRVDRSRTPVTIDPSLTTATTADIHAAVEQAKEQFRNSSQQYHDLVTATAADVQAALLQSSDPNVTADSLGFKVGDVIRKVTSGNTTTYTTVNSNIADSFRNGLKNAIQNLGIGVGNVVRVTTDQNGNKTYSAVSDAEAAEYRAALEHNAYYKLNHGDGSGSGSSGTGSGQNP